MRVLESERLLIKPVEKEDLQYLLELRWDASVMNFLIHEPLSMADQERWFDRLDNRNCPCCIYMKSENGPERAGTVGLYDISTRHQRGTWRIRIDAAQQGKGVATEATTMMLDYGFNTLNLHKIISDSFKDNQAIVKLSLKLGLTQEGLLREHYYHQGKHRDAIQFGMLKEQFNSKP